MKIGIGLALLLIGVLQASADATGPDLEAWMSRAITNLAYQPPTAAEFKRARELFAHTLKADRAMEELKSGWQELGFGFYEITADGKTLWLVSEPPGKEFGRGWYLFRTHSDSSMALEAPHARNDVHTGIITLRMFLAGQVRVLAESTITRHKADMARLDDSFFQAFTLAYGEVCPTGLIVQFHGFETDNHEGVKADIIASTGTRSAEPWLGHVVQRVRKATSLAVLAYPQDTKTLGATVNIQGQALRKAGHCRFLHLELTRELRDQLTRDAALRRAILESLPAAQQP